MNPSLLYLIYLYTKYSNSVSKNYFKLDSVLTFEFEFDFNDQFKYKQQQHICWTKKVRWTKLKWKRKATRDMTSAKKKFIKIKNYIHRINFVVVVWRSLNVYLYYKNCELYKKSIKLYSYFISHIKNAYEQWNKRIIIFTI